MSTDRPALTKRQKKAEKFKSKRKSDDSENVEATDAAESEQCQVDQAETVAPPNDTSSCTLPVESLPLAQESKESTPAQKPKKKKLKKIFDDDGTVHEEVVPEPPSKENGIKYIVFVGNMSFDVTADMLAKHLGETCGEIPKVRLLTKKADPKALEGLSTSKKKSIARGKAKDPSAPVSKGCAFVEFSNGGSLQKALRFHHTMFHGRQINVELTAGGGGKSQHRKEKIKAKNDSLEKERRKIHEKYVKPAAEEHKRKMSEVSTEKSLPGWEKSQEGSQPPKRAKFASGANAIRLG
ncbi:hypothetical protein MNAN1_001129 [Malassezia nana]|uniref:RRM domain-containing protein n=1 Tax=Malassezia nana TaxID=180528 RepID=A0AAF0J2X9_9BASI|nr:hypothetical protein MNAN1_001129 [Malassezia nana]